MIKIEFDDQVVSDDDMKKLSLAVRDIVSEVTGIKDVFVYANSARIKVAIAPIEIFIQMSAEKIKDQSDTINAFKLSIREWKKNNSFSYPINLTLVPMHWSVEIDI